jgi:DNA-binding MarR family transcriptional regulator
VTRARAVPPSTLSKKPAEASAAWQPSSEALRFMQTLFALVHALDVRSKRMARTIGVTGPQRLVVRVIGQHPDATAGDIARMLDLHASTLTGVLARLEERGMIARHVDPNDRRRARFALTARGRRVDRERKGTVEAAVRRALTRSPDATTAHAATMMRALVEELSRED